MEGPNCWNGAMMLSENSVKEWATRWQTTQLNVQREFLQHIFLSVLYQQPFSEKMFFKGGTALRVVFGSPRFSEDLDFSANISSYTLSREMERWAANVSQYGAETKITENKPTSGGHFAIFQSRLQGETVSITCNVSLRKKGTPEAVLVASPLLPSYQCLILKTGDLVAEKIAALLTRKKPRDFFDLYFLLRERRGLEAILPLKEKLLTEVGKAEAKSLYRELKLFLPANYQKIASHLPECLQSELKKL